MPNWVFNTLTIEGPREQLEDLTKKAHLSGDREDPEESCLSFKNFIPYPNGVWAYNWCVSNWGTKWDACDPYLEDGGGQDILYSFSTAWSPPTPVVRKMIETYPELSFSHYYEEPGCDYQGLMEGSNGEVQEDTCGLYHPECYECGEREYPSDECEYDDYEDDYFCPKCYIKLNESHDWDEETNERT